MKNMIKNLGKFLGVIALSSTLSGCFGELVEVPPATIGKIMTKDGYKEGYISTSKFRLDPCINYCDKIILLPIADQSFNEKMDLFIPKDKLEMSFDLRMTLAISPNKYDELFDRIPAVNNVIPSSSIYVTYAQQIIRSEVREILSQYSIGEIASNRQEINAILTNKLEKSIKSKTPYVVRYIGLADVKYPQVIIDAQVNAAERREQIESELASIEISKVRLERELQEKKMQRAIDVEKANAEAEVNKILANSVTQAYKDYHNIQVMYKLAESQNKMFVPVEMLSGLSGQVALGNQVK